MSIKTKLSVAFSALLIAGCGSIAGADAATPACGPSCIDLFSSAYGPNYVPAVRGSGAAAGQLVALARSSATAPSQDFAVSEQGTVSDFIAAGLMAPGMDIYGSLEVDEFEYAPSGVDSGLCLGVGVTPVTGTRVALEPCGVSVRTTWVIDSVSPSGLPPASPVPLINGATDQSFANPQVLTAVFPYLPLYTSRLYTPKSGKLLGIQTWGANTGPLTTNG